MDKAWRHEPVQEKTKQARRRARRLGARRWLILGGGLLLLVLLARGVWLIRAKAEFARAQYELSEANNQKLAVSAQALTKRLELLETERGREEEIRRRFNVALPGEAVIILPEQTATPLNTFNEEEKPSWLTIVWTRLGRLTHILVSKTE